MLRNSTPDHQPGVKLWVHDSGYSLSYYCPGCKRPHSINHQPGHGPTWTWTGGVEKPTFHPSVACSGTEPSDDPEKFDDPKFDVSYVCHVYVREGMIEFLGDCTHSLKGQTVAMPDWPGKAAYDNL